ncbi:MAG: hypothetical protein A3E87_08050 [Gammaproteobacteria bacterium RIFCSPHIGHO2_12_FULL_35_23]|nr:MAG: hypothetical protein A3E87_08050 [Gammaproteobacteria bacterium RIFCSPHIGHO2_12_FULL_35_23]
MNIKKQIVFLIVGIICVVFIIGIFKYHHSSVQSTFEQQAVVVSTISAKKIEATQIFSFIGSIKAEKAINITTETNGIIQSINFNSGQLVSKGQLLIVLQHDNQGAALEKATAEYGDIQDQYHRSRQLYAMRIVSQAAIVEIKFKLKEAKANLDQAKAAYDRCFIKAPFSGELGISQVSPGEYITAGQTIVNLQSVPAIYVDFSVPEAVVGFLNQKAIIKIKSQEGGKPMQATIAAIDSDIDLSTRTLMVRARILNSSSLLKPGSFVTVNITIPSDQQVLVIPSIAVDYEPYGASIYVVQNNHAKLRYIQISGMHADQVIIKSGLKAGEKIVIAGQDKLHDGDLVTISPNVIKE